MSRTPYLLIVGYCLLLLYVFPLQGQTILQQTTFEDINYSHDVYKWFEVDGNQHYCVGIEKTRSDTEGLLVGDSLIPAYQHYPQQLGLGLSDMFLFKINQQNTFINGLVVDNAERICDFVCGSQYALFSMGLSESQANKDSFPILINGVHEVPREGYRGKGVLIVMDANLVFQKYFFPSTGDIGQVALDGHMAYLELRIPSREPFIIVNGTDTIHNQHSFDDPDDFGRQTVVLCKYNLLADEVEWTLRIGNVGHEELKEMQIDEAHNLVILGETSSTYFSFHDTDTVMNYADHSPFVAKYTSDGEFLAGFINPNDENAHARALLLDRESNFYVLGFYYGDTFAIADTVLIRPGLGRPTGSQSTLTKLNSNGEFEWIKQADGDFEQTGFYDMAELNHDQLIICGSFSGGQLVMNGQTYNDDPVADKKFGYLIKVNKEQGTIDDHIMTVGDYRREFYDVEVDLHGNVDLFMRFRGSDTIFNGLFETSLDAWNGYLLKLKLSPVFNEEPGFDNFQFTIAPNPVSGEGFSLINHNRVRGSYAILDMMGHVLQENDVLPDQNTVITASNWPPGPYWIQVKTDDHLQTQLLIIQD